MQKDQTEAEEVTEKLKTTDRLEIGLHGVDGGGGCLYVCMGQSICMERDGGRGVGCLYVCMGQCICMERDGGRGVGCLYVCMAQCVYLERDGGGGCLPFRSSKKQATCESCFAGHSICSAISLHSGISSLFNRQSGMHREQEL